MEEDVGKESEIKKRQECEEETWGESYAVDKELRRKAGVIVKNNNKEEGTTSFALISPLYPP